MMELHLSISINELMETKMQLKSAKITLNRKWRRKTKDDLTQQLVCYTTKILYSYSLNLSRSNFFVNFMVFEAPINILSLKN